MGKRAGDTIKDTNGKQRCSTSLAIHLLEKLKYKIQMIPSAGEM